MTAMLPLHLFFLYLLLGEPVLGWWLYRRFRRQLAHDPAARRRFYARTVALVWVLALALLLGAWSAGIGLRELWTPPFSVGELFTVVGTGLLVGALVGVLLPVVLVRVSAAYREKVRGAFASLDPLLPATPAERRWWGLLSLTAGICEELIYRGFLFWYLRQALPDLLIVLVVSSLVFGLAHVYQGVKGVLGTALVGFAFGGLYAITGSLLAPMALHAAFDLRVLWMLPEQRGRG